MSAATLRAISRRVAPAALGSTSSTVLPRAGAAVFQRSAFPARSFALGVAAGDYNTPGFEPTVGTKIPGKIGVQKARSWDDAVGDSFKATHTSEIFGNGKVVLFVVPAAFAGPCSTGHVPSFARNAAAMKAKGVSKIVCMAVDNPYAINGWVKSMGKNAEGVEFYGDVDGTFTQFMHKKTDLSKAAMGPGERSNRYAAIVEDGVIKALCVEAGPGEVQVSTGEEILKVL